MDDTSAEIDRMETSQTLAAGVSKGLVKAVNEDRLRCLQSDGQIRIVIADGHWGPEAAQMAADYWSSIPVPSSREEAVRLTQELERQISARFGMSRMGTEKDFTPETSFLLVNIANKKLRVIGYGDCRALLTRAGMAVYEYRVVSTWLGAFSKLGLRQRQSVQSALVFDELSVQPGDTLLVFSDGVDECIYETPTISKETLIATTGHTSAEKVFDEIFHMVFDNGAEDNASLAVVKIT